MELSVILRRAFVFVCICTLVLPSIAFASKYTVVSGDSLYTISEKTNVGIAKIKGANNLSGDIIHPGQVLNIPDGKSTATKQPVSKPSKTTYAVKPGDTLSVIAQKYKVSVDALTRANGLSGSLIHPGQQLVIPNGTTSNATTKATQVSRSAERPTIPFTDQDLDLLARLVNAEAGGESLTAQIGVAAVVINRVQSNHFPNSIRDVIYAPNQFSPVRNGWINKPATATSIKAATAALHGNDPTNGALYFFDSSSSSSFLRSLPVAATFGKMIYAKR